MIADGTSGRSANAFLVQRSTASSLLEPTSCLSRGRNFPLCENQVSHFEQCWELRQYLTREKSLVFRIGVFRCILTVNFHSMSFTSSACVKERSFRVKTAAGSSSWYLNSNAYLIHDYYNTILSFVLFLLYVHICTLYKNAFAYASLDRAELYTISLIPTVSLNSSASQQPLLPPQPSISHKCLSIQPGPHSGTDALLQTCRKTEKRRTHDSLGSVTFHKAACLFFFFFLV